MHLNSQTELYGMWHQVNLNHTQGTDDSEVREIEQKVFVKLAAMCNSVE
jgi:hypothetical protein